jgi:fucose 4-O-acetylase-like acetyltransferase
MRETWLDTAKGLGIILVVVAHVLDNSAWRWAQPVYFAASLFFMPFFFVISGYLFAVTDRRALFRKRAKGLLIPYVMFLGAIMASVLLVDLLRGDIPAPWQIRELVTNALMGGRHLTRELGVFWFITCLFFTQLVYNEVAIRTSGPTDLGMLFFVGASVGLAYLIQTYWQEVRAPLALTNVPLAIGAFWFGHFLRERGMSALWSAVFVVGVAGVALAAARAGSDFTFSMKNAVFGPPLLGLLVALAISTFVLGLIRFMEMPSLRIAPLAEIGAASLVIMFVHQFVHFTLRDFGISSEVALIAVSLGLPYLLYRGLRSSQILSPWFLGSGDLSRSINLMTRSLMSRAR